MHTFKIQVSLLTLIFYLLIPIAHLPAAPKEPLQAAMEATGAEVEEISINAWTKLDKDYNQEELISLCNHVTNQFGTICTSEPQIVKDSTGRIRLIRQDITQPGLHLAVIIQSVYSPSTAVQETYVVVNVDYLVNCVLDNHWNTKIYEILQQIGGNPHITTCLVGWVDGKLEQSDQQYRLHNAIVASDATEVDFVTTEQYTSATAFTPCLVDKLQIGSKFINLNLVMRYSPLEERTCVMVGTPVISRDY